ncbi:hypothetical protein WI697_10370 [Tistrella mobilis]|uniref:hypothetical protein n=1 Tax=Tistrella mobilis TaxID=171437 RepID=UPI0031F64CCB
MDQPLVPIYSTDATDSHGARKPWQKPVLNDADVSAFTTGTGTSGVEGIPFLKPGS